MLITTDKEALGVWTRLTDLFSIWRLVVFATLGGRSIMPWRKNNLGDMLRTNRWKIGLGLLGGLDDAQIDFLERFSAINARRVDHVFRASALILVSIPVAGVVAVNELAPEVFSGSGLDFLFTLITIIAVWAFFAGLMMAAAWRARDLHDLVEFEQARRRFEQARAAEETSGA